MFRTNLKIAWRHLLRNRIYSLTTIGGLAIGMTAFLMSLLYETHLANFDAWDPGFKNVYQIRLITPSNGYTSTYLSPLMMPVLRLQVPDIRSATRVNFNNQGTLLRIGENRFYENDIVNADSTFFEVFPFALIAGDRRTALQDQHSIVISEELAEKYFKGVNPIGQHIRWDERKDYVVTGVLAKPAGPTQTKINALMRIVVPDWASWGNFAYKNYVKLDEHADTRQIGEKMTKAFLGAAYENMKIWNPWPSTLKAFLADKKHDYLELLNISAVALEESEGDLLTLAFLSVIILLVACINFINQTIASADSRAREIGVRKAMGGLRAGLAGQFLLEIFLQCFFAIFIGMILLELGVPYYNRLIHEDINFLAYCASASFLLKLAGTLLGVTLLAGLYPAFYLSAFLPAKVLKGDLERGNGGLLLRKVLLGFQFTFSLAFIICLIILSGQTRFMQNFNPGFNPADLTYVTIQEANTQKNFAYIRQQLLEIPHINGAALADYLPWGDGGNGDMVSYGEKELNLQQIRVGDGFFSTMGVKMKEGREYTAQDPRDSIGGYIVINEATAKVFNIPEPVVGQTLRYQHSLPGEVKVYKIIGVATDFMLKNFKSSIGPAVFLKDIPNTYMVLLNIDPRYNEEAMNKVRQVWKTVEPGHPMVYSTVRNDFGKATESYTRLVKTVSLIATVTIVIAIVGLLALVSYNLKRRMKEIGIRKVVGASLTDILSMIFRDFLYLLLVANVVAWCLAWLLMSKFLSQFAYQIPMPWMVFPLVTLISGTATAAIISARVWRAVHTTPAEVLKYE